MYAPCRPRFKFDAREYRPDAPQEDAGLREQLDNVSLEPYVRESNTPAPVPLHTRLPRRLPVLTAEPLEPPKPAVTYQDKDTQTDPVVVVPAPEKAAQDLYLSHVRSEAAELRSDNIRLQREVDALTLAMKKLSSAEERRLAEDKRRLEQLERAEEQTRREQLERAARSAEERRLAEDKRRLELERAAEERRLAEEKSAEQRRLAEATRLEQLERDRQARERLLPPVQPARAAARPKPAKPATPAVPLARTRTLKRTGK